MGADTFIDEALAFTERHRDLDPQQHSFGGLVWGMLRAIAECPNDPGVFRVPVDADGKQLGPLANWAYLACPKCGGVWAYQEPKPEPIKAKRKRSR